MAMFYAYILRCSDDSYYVGSSDDPDRRLIEHSQRKSSDWTAARRPVTLVWIEEHSTLSYGSQAREPNKTMESRKEGRFGRRFPSTPLRTRLNRPQLPPPPKFREAKFCPERARSQGESKGKIAMFYADILRSSDDSYCVGTFKRCAAGTSGPHTGCNQSFRRPRR